MLGSVGDDAGALAAATTGLELVAARSGSAAQPGDRARRAASAARRRPRSPPTIGSARPTTPPSCASSARRTRRAALASASRATRTCCIPCTDEAVLQCFVLFEQIRSGGCLSYLIGCEDTCAGTDRRPAARAARSLPRAGRRARPARALRRRDPHPRRSLLGGARARQGARRADRHAPHSSPAPFAERARRRRRDRCSRQAARCACCTRRATPSDSMCLVLADRVLTGDTLLIGGTGRTDLPTGDPDDALRQPVRQAAARSTMH